MKALAAGLMTGGMNAVLVALGDLFAVTQIPVPNVTPASWKAQVVDALASSMSEVLGFVFGIASGIIVAEFENGLDLS